VNTSVLASPVFSALAASLIVLLVGDFASTFFYHVPQHAWGKLHLRTHHDRRRSYWDHAVLSRDPQVLLDGLLGAVPYIVLALLCAVISVPGAILGLLLGQAHVWWRHTTELGWRTPPWFVRIARAIGLVLPEDHDGHHRNPEIEFGDIFRFYDVPARVLLVTLRSWSRAVVRKRSRRSTPVRRAAALKRRAVAKQS
jgi:sterol desaturase/sphingolipid hydroxylase (fatty acid hydroxylase superfamily)